MKSILLLFFIFTSSSDGYTSQLVPEKPWLYTFLENKDSFGQWSEDKSFPGRIVWKSTNEKWWLEISDGLCNEECQKVNLRYSSDFQAGESSTPQYSVILQKIVDGINDSTGPNARTLVPTVTLRSSYRPAIDPSTPHVELLFTRVEGESFQTYLFRDDGLVTSLIAKDRMKDMKWESKQFHMWPIKNNATISLTTDEHIQITTPSGIKIFLDPKTFRVTHFGGVEQEYIPIGSHKMMANAGINWSKVDQRPLIIYYARGTHLGSESVHPAQASILESRVLRPNNQTCRLMNSELFDYHKEDSDEHRTIVPGLFESLQEKCPELNPESDKAL